MRGGSGRGGRTWPGWYDRALIIGVLILSVLTLFTVGVEIGRRTGEDVPPTATVPTAIPTTPPVAPPSPVATPVTTSTHVVCLDPGHGGSDLGNVRVENGEIVLQEKDFTLAHSRELAARLQANGIGVVMTRTTDTEVNPTNTDVNGDGDVASPGLEAKSDQLDDLQARVNICNEAGADLLVSVHYNGAENLFLKGFEVWYNDERPFSDQSLRFATLIHEELGQRYADAGMEMVDRGIGIEAHAVTGPARPGELVPADMPGVVVEGLFLSNDADAAFVETDAAREAIVTAYEQAIMRYFAETPV